MKKKNLAGLVLGIGQNAKIFIQVFDSGSRSCGGWSRGAVLVRHVAIGSGDGGGSILNYSCIWLVHSLTMLLLLLLLLFNTKTDFIVVFICIVRFKFQRLEIYIFSNLKKNTKHLLSIIKIIIIKLLMNILQQHAINININPTESKRINSTFYLMYSWGACWNNIHLKLVDFYERKC